MLPAGLFALLLSGCPGSIDDPAPFLGASGEACPSDFDVEEDLFARTCGTLGCHTGGPSLAAAGLDLTTEGVAPRLLAHTSAECGDRPLIEPGDVAGSYLIEKVRPDPACGGRMPSGLPPLNPTEQACLEAYVADLAGAAPGDAAVPPRPDAGPPPADAGAPDAGPAPSPVTYEAEAMTLETYVVDPNDGDYIRLPDGATTGSARVAFDGAPGAYELTVRAVTEPDGQPTLRVRVAGELVETVTYPLATAGDFEERAFGPWPVTLGAGDEIVLEGDSDGAAWARVDALELTP